MDCIGLWPRNCQNATEGTFSFGICHNNVPGTKNSGVMGGEERVQSQMLWHLIPHTAWTCGSSACVTHIGGPDSSAPAPLAILPGWELPATASCPVAFPNSTFLTAAQTSGLELWASLQVGRADTCGNATLVAKEAGASQELPLPLWPGRAGGSDPGLPKRRLVEMDHLKDTVRSQFLPTVD